MKIYYMEQNENTGYDTYSDCVVIAENIEDAKTIHPNGYEFKENEDWATWAFTRDGILVAEIGTPNDDQKRGVVCASFHAG